jgi:hypothetical protein
MIYKIVNFVMLDSSRFKSIYLITMLYIPFLFAVGDWGLGALFRRATKKEIQLILLILSKKIL